MVKILSFLFFSIFVFADYHNTPDWWQCDNRNGGSWQFGLAPDVCDTDFFLKQSYIEKNFNPYIFDNDQDREDEQFRYMTELNALIKNVVFYFLNQKQPDMNVDEKDVFLRAIYALSHQESYWTQYRSVENYPQMMRSGGDRGHGHGIFQVDDRWHFVALNEGVGANIVKNMLYSLEEYYAGWRRSRSKSCVSDDEDYIAMARSAYASYNGGPSKICRWTNEDDRWARNDKGFYDKFQKQSWQNYVDSEVSVKVDIQCIADDYEDCAINEAPKVDYQTIYKTKDEELCVYTSKDQISCLATLRDKACLKTVRSNLNFDSIAVLDNDELQKKYLDRHHACANSVDGLIGVLSKVKLLKNINLRRTPGGQLLTTIPKESNLIVLDFFIDGDKRYYQVSYQNNIGYFYAGSTDYANWAISTNDTITESDQFQQIKIEGFYQSQKAIQFGEFEIAAGEAFKVKNLTVSGTENNIFLTVEYQGDTVDIKWAQTFPLVHFYYDLTETDAPQKFAKLPYRNWYKFLRACPEKTCQKRGIVRGPRLSRELIKIISEDNRWSYVSQRNYKGWIESRYLIIKE